MSSSSSNTGTPFIRQGCCWHCGNPFDWKIVRTAFNNWHGALVWNDVKRLLGNRRARFIIAGGLSPENVGQAMKVFALWGVDVVSGIEREPGRKDPKKMKALIAAVRKAETQ